MAGTSFPVSVLPKEGSGKVVDVERIEEGRYVSG